MTARPTETSLDERERLSRHGDSSPEAISLRLKAALKVSQLSQKELATEIGRPLTTVNSQIKAGSPSIDLMRYFYKGFRVDFNFLLHGDLAQLPGDVQLQLTNALAGIAPAEERPTS